MLAWIGGVVLIVALSGGGSLAWRRLRGYYCPVCGQPWDWAHHVHGFGCPHSR